MRLLMMGFDGLGYSPARFTVGDLLELRTLYAPLPVTGPSWTSMYTGLTAKQHKVRDAWGRPKDGHKTPADSSQHFFWRRLQRELGMKTSLCFVPMIKPSYAFADFCVEGFPIQDRQKGPQVQGAGLARYTGEMLAQTDIMYWPGSSATPAQWAQPLRKRYTLTQMVEKVTVGSYLALNWWLEHGVEGYDFGFISWMIPDHPAHVWPWQWANDILPLIRKLIEYALEQINPQTLIIVSDHGFCMDGTGHTHAGVIGTKGLSFELPKRANILHNWSVPGVVFKELGLETEIKKKNPAELSEGELKHIEHRLKELGYIE